LNDDCNKEEEEEQQQQQPSSIELCVTLLLALGILHASYCHYFSF
jgi:hypothetical protein